MDKPTPEDLRAIRKAYVLSEMRQWIEKLREPREEDTKTKRNSKKES